MTAAPQLLPQGRLPAWTAALSEARWLGEKRIVAYSRIIVVINVLAIVAMLALSPHFIDPTGKPVGTDFLGFWSAGQMALEGHAEDAYDYDREFDRQKLALPGSAFGKSEFFPWHYPPIFFNVVALLALLPYGAALGVWVLLSVPIYLAAIRGILPGRNAMMAALAFPAVLSNLAHGQNGFVTAGLMGGALLLLERRPWLSGVLFGLLAYKPQFAAIIPLALLVGGCWRTILSAGLTLAGTIATSWVIWGGAAWRAFFASLPVTRTYELEQGPAGWQKIQSVFSAVRMFGGGIGLAYGVQAVFAMMAVAALVWIWRKPVGVALKGSALATVALMVTPYVLDYDLIVLALPIAWLAGIGLREGFLPWEKIALLAVWLLPLLSRAMGSYLHFPPAPFAMALLLVIIFRRTARVQVRQGSVTA